MKFIAYNQLYQHWVYQLNNFKNISSKSRGRIPFWCAKNLNWKNNKIYEQNYIYKNINFNYLGMIPEIRGVKYFVDFSLF